MTLPIEAVVPDLIAALRHHGQAVLQAPPGAGKTTRIPLAMLEAGLCEGRIVMLEPRRLAARSAAERMAETLGQSAGQTVGYRMRGASAVSPDTRIEVVTEGILTRMLQSDPELTGVGAVVFDEFHERSLNADLGLALTLEARAALRPDLIVLPMSATLDAAPVAALMGDAPVITAEGRSFPVETRWLDSPNRAREGPVARLIRELPEVLSETTGGVLVFVPGEREVRQVVSSLVQADVVVHPLYGALPFADQRRALRPDPDRRKVVVATAIAETSLTIEDVRVVVDAGLSRRARFDPGSGMSRLITERVTRAEATQRAGRAGRVAEGICYRMWTRGEDGALAAFPPPEIAATDLSGLAVELARWGGCETQMPFLTPPPEAALAEARALLTQLGVMRECRLTPHGEAVAALPLHPRLAHMLVTVGRDAALLAALLAGRDPLRVRSADVALRLRALRDRHPELRGGREILAEAKRIGRMVPEGGADYSVGQTLALAYPDRIGLRRKGEAPRYVLSGGKGAVLAADDDLAGQRLIVASDLDGDATEARIRQAAPITEAEVRELFADQIASVTLCEWSRREGKVLARRQERLGAVVLEDQVWSDADDASVAAAMCEGVRQLGLRTEGKAALFRARVMLVRARVPDLPDMSEAALMERLEDWLLPHLGGVQSAAAWKRFDVLPALHAMLDWSQMALVDREAPAHFETPLGRKTPLDYSGEAPEIAVRLQEMFGLTRHPCVADTPIRITLLSPAGRPVQTTTDLPGFWASSYADVRKDMRGRYPRHPWPEDPTVADPTVRAKRRGT